MNRNQVGKGIAYVVVAMAIAIFALYFWWTRVGEEERGSAEQGDAPQALVPIPDPMEGKPTESQATRATATLPSKSDALIQPDETVSAGSAPPQSITFHELPIQPYAVNGVIPKPFVPRADASSGVWEKRSRSISVHADPQGCSECSSSQFWGINIPNECEYFSYTVMQVHRYPAARIEESSRFTSYSDGPLSDSTGRITGIQISARTQKFVTSPVTPSITMRLTVVALCPSDAMTEGWREVAE